MQDEQMLRQLEQQQQIIDALLETRKSLLAQQAEASAGLAAQMASLSFDVGSATRKSRKRGEEESRDSDDMRCSGSTADAWGSSDALQEFSVGEFDEEEVVYRSCALDESELAECLAQQQADEDERRACLDQLSVLSMITTELQADVWADPSAAAASLQRLVALSSQLSAMRQAQALGRAL